MNLNILLIKGSGYCSVIWPPLELLKHTVNGFHCVQSLLLWARVGKNGKVGKDDAKKKFPMKFFFITLCFLFVHLHRPSWNDWGHCTPLRFAIYTNPNVYDTCILGCFIDHFLDEFSLVNFMSDGNRHQKYGDFLSEFFYNGFLPFAAKVSSSLPFLWYFIYTSVCY